MRRAPNPPYEKWLNVLGSPVKKVRFHKSGNVDVVIVPRSRNESYRKVKKQVRKLQRAGALEPGPMFQKFRKAAKISKTGRKRNPSSYIVYPGTGSPKSFGFLKSAKKWAKEQANASGISSVIYPQGKGKTHHVYPDRKSKSNPLVSTPTTFHHRLGKYQLLPKRVHSDGTVDFLYAEGGIGQDFSVGPQGGIIGRLPPFAHGNAKKLARIAREQDR